MRRRRVQQIRHVLVAPAADRSRCRSHVVGRRGRGKAKVCRQAPSRRKLQYGQGSGAVAGLAVHPPPALGGLDGADDDRQRFGDQASETASPPQAQEHDG